MQLDPELLRLLLLRIEASPPNQRVTSITVDGYDENAVFEHLELLMDDGLIEGTMHGGGMGQGRIAAAVIDRLTMSGHNFLNNARNDTVWRKSRAVIKEKVGTVSFELLKVLVVQAAKAQLGIP
jgi:hypothetical protein